MSLLQQIQTDLTAAMKAKDELRLTVLRQIKTALSRYEKDQTKPLDETSEQRTLGTLVKQHRDSIDAFSKGARPALAAKELAELRIIESYMPQEATEAEIDAAVEKAFAEFLLLDAIFAERSKPNMGALMTGAKKVLAGKRADGRMLSEKVKAKCG